MVPYDQEATCKPHSGQFVDTCQHAASGRAATSSHFTTLKTHHRGPSHRQYPTSHHPVTATLRQTPAVPHCLLQVEFEPNTVILRRGQRPDYLYIVKEERALLKEGSKVVGRKEAGGTFGECALRSGEVCASDVVSEGRLVCYQLGRASICSLLGPLEDVWRYQVLKQVGGGAWAGQRLAGALQELQSAVRD